MRECLLVSVIVSTVFGLALTFVAFANHWTAQDLAGRTILVLITAYARSQWGDPGSAMCVSNGGVLSSCEHKAVEFALKMQFGDPVALYANQKDIDGLIRHMRAAGEDQSANNLRASERDFKKIAIESVSLPHLSLKLSYVRKVGVHPPYYAANIARIIDHSSKQADFSRNPFLHGVLVGLHGGGHVFGDEHTVSHLLSYFVNRFDIPALSLDYSLAPERLDNNNNHNKTNNDGINHIQINEAMSLVVDFLHNQVGVPMQNIYLIGDSAGGGMVLSLTQAIQEKVMARDILANVRIAMVISPWTELCFLLNKASFEKHSDWDGVIGKNGTRMTAMIALLGYNQTQQCLNEYSQSCAKEYQRRCVDGLISPAHGSYERIYTNYLFVSSNFELLRDDTMILYNDFKALGISADLINLDTSLHDAPMLHQFPEHVRYLNRMSRWFAHKRTKFYQDPFDVTA